MLAYASSGGQSQARKMHQPILESKPCRKTVKHVRADGANEFRVSQRIEGDLAGICSPRERAKGGTPSCGNSEGGVREALLNPVALGRQDARRGQHLGVPDRNEGNDLLKNDGDEDERDQSASG